MFRLKEQYLDQVATFLKAVRKEKNLTTREAAEIVGLHQPQLVRIETKKHELRLNNLEAIATLLGYDIELDIKFVKRDK